MLEQAFSRDQAEGLRQLMTAPPARQISLLVSSDELDRDKLYRLLVSEMTLRDTSCLTEIDATDDQSLKQLMESDKEIVICLSHTADGIKQAYRILKTLANYNNAHPIGIYVAANSSKQAKTIFKNLYQLAECSLRIQISFVGHTTIALPGIGQEKTISHLMR